jgi:hypothetical protein
MVNYPEHLFLLRLEFFLDFVHINTFHDRLEILDFQCSSSAGRFGLILTILAFESGY